MGGAGPRRVRGGRRPVGALLLLRAAARRARAAHARHARCGWRSRRPRNRWEADYVAPRFPLARGWLRQLESDDFDLFTDGNLTPAAYRSWLDGRRGLLRRGRGRRSSTTWPTDEEALIRRGLPYLRAVWSDEHWRLYRVEGSAGLVSTAGDSPARRGRRDRLTALGPASFTLSARDSGAFLVRVRYTRYWTVTSGERVRGARRRLDRGRGPPAGDRQRRRQVQPRRPVRPRRGNARHSARRSRRASPGGSPTSSAACRAGESRPSPCCSSASRWGSSWRWWSRWRSAATR